MKFKLALLSLCLVSAATMLLAQNTGSISAVVTDQSGAALPDATVTVINQAQGGALSILTTNNQGAFVATPLNPGNYTVNVEAPGFRTYTQQNIVVQINDRVGLPNIVMQIGAVGESITVEAAAVQLETVSAERSGVVTGRQVVDIAVNGRNYTTLMRTVPGAAVDGAFGGNANFNGQRNFQNNFTVDGQNVTDTGVNQQFAYRINLDAIQEFKVTTNSQAAEFGRNSGAQIQVATKSGTSDYHGTAWWFKRGEFMNANDYIRNSRGLDRSIYRFMQAGWNLGGPVPSFGDFNRNRDKLFFFASNEWGRSKTPQQSRRVTVPTALERAGNFSQTVDGGGQPVIIIDPANGLPFDGNIIPEARFNEYGPALLNWLPMPNVTGNRQFNYETQVPNTAPTYDQVYRVDYNISDKWRLYVRHLNSKSTQNNPYGRADTSNNLALSDFLAPTYGWSLLGNIVTIVSPSVINDFQFGYTVNGIPGDPPPADSPYYRANNDVRVPLLFPEANTIGLVPNLIFGGIPGDNNNRMTNFQGTPYDNRNPVWNITDNVTKIKGDHTMKFGFYYEYAVKSENPFRSLNGTFDFSRDQTNPNDSGWAFSNTLLGNFNSFSQTSASLLPEYPYNQVEWFAQDSWKVSDRLTLNYGLRMSWIQPLYDKQDQMANFSFADFDPNQVVQLAPDGSLVPGVGNRFNGMVLSGQGNTPRGLIQDRGIHWGPRVGLAYNLNDKTVFRMGGGAFYERIATFTVGYTSNYVTNPPTLTTPEVLRGNLSNLQGAEIKDNPLGVTRISDDGHVPSVYNYSAGIQRQLPGSMVLDVSYVGSQSRHLTLGEPFNNILPGQSWLPQNQAPGATAPFDGSQALAPNFYRPYIGYTSGTQFTTGTSANYNALQVGLNKRQGRVLLGVAYTWSKAMGVDAGHVLDTRTANYGPLNLDRTHTLTFNYVYDLPSFADRYSFLNNTVGRVLANGWQLSGLTTMSSGAPANVTYSQRINGQLRSGAALNQLITGSPDVSPRPVFTCNPKLSHGDKTPDQFFDTSCFTPAPVGSVGMDSGFNQLRGPGTHQWDMSLFKKINFTESTYVQLRLEAFNVFNHTQWGSLATAAQFDANGNLENLPSQIGGGAGSGGFGALTNVRGNSQRILQIAAKFYF